MERAFIDSAFAKAINDYLKSSENPKGITYNSFLVVVIRALISIYGELDIINPVMQNDEDLLKKNLAKFNYPLQDIELFFQNIEMYEKSDNKKGNKYFIAIQKQLIDMLIMKKLNYYLTELEVSEFYDLLYTPYAKNPLRVSFNFLMANDVLEIDNYYKNEMKNNVKMVIPEEKHYLNVKAYELLNYSMDDIKSMNSSEIEKINTQVYDYFKIRENAINKEYLLEKAIEELEKEKNKVTSGNGYVDILLVLSVICTVMMLVGIITFIII